MAFTQFSSRAIFVSYAPRFCVSSRFRGSVGFSDGSVGLGAGRAVFGVGSARFGAGRLGFGFRRVKVLAKSDDEDDTLNQINMDVRELLQLSTEILELVEPFETKAWEKKKEYLRKRWSIYFPSVLIIVNIALFWALAVYFSHRLVIWPKLSMPLKAFVKFISKFI